MTGRISDPELDSGVMHSLSHTDDSTYASGAKGGYVSHRTARVAAHSCSSKARLRQLTSENTELRNRAVELILLIQWMRDVQAANSNIAANSNVAM